jgi:uncharacterized protein YerC
MNNSSDPLESPTSAAQEGALEEQLLLGNRRSMLQNSQALRMEDWPTVDQLSLETDKQDLFAKRYRAFTLYRNGAALAQIHAETGISPQRFYQLLDRCLMVHPDGLTSPRFE